ncbi:MAG: gliding motility lipoprotein GldH [Flavobacteriaceae bacterium]|nr:gliding motility lipoprotein GldH [Flavobacteriaceae bacterium]
MNKYFWWLFLWCILGISCSDEVVVHMVSVDNSWKKNEAKNLEFEIKDAQNPKNIIFVVRNNNEYPYSNLFLIASLKNAKNEVLKTDTLQYVLAKPNGEWLGKGWGSVKEILLQYKTNYQFPFQGKYHLEVKHGMRRDTLRGIEDIGIKIESLSDEK